jgi:agmatinase
MSDKDATMKNMFGGQPTGGFFDLPVSSPGQLNNERIVIVGAPSATPYKSVGAYCANAPAAIRAAFGWPGVSNHYDFDLGGPLLPEGVGVVDWGDLDYDLEDFSLNRERIKSTVIKVLDQGAVPVVLGGDDSLPIPVLGAYQEHGPITILQLDAHIDWRDKVAGESMGLSSNMRRASEMGWVEGIIQVGARGMGSARPQDYQDAVDWGVQFFPMQQCVAEGFQCVIDALPQNAKLFITLDIDVMDPAAVPAVIGPAPGGMTYWQLVALLKAAAGKCDIAGFDLAELMPDNDIGGRGALVAARAVAIMLNLIANQQ